MLNKFLLCAVVPVALLSGCATNVSTLNPDLSMCTEINNNPSSDTSVFIQSVSDERVFAENAPSADMPTWSNDGTHEEDRAIGRKRNGFGMALGGIVLPQGITATSIVERALSQAFKDNGYYVIKNAAEVNNNTKIIDIKMTQYWSWMNPGAFTITLTSDIKADVTGYSSEPVNVHGNYSENFAFGTESSWLKVINQAIKNFLEDARNKLK